MTQKLIYSTDDASVWFVIKGEEGDEEITMLFHDEQNCEDIELGYKDLMPNGMTPISFLATIYDTLDEVSKVLGRRYIDAAPSE